MSEGLHQAAHHDDEETTRQVLASYFSAFASRDVPAAIDHLHDDFFFDRGSWPPLRGRDDFASFYERLWAHAEESIEAVAWSWHGATMRVELVVDLVVRSEVRDFPDGPLAAGQRIHVTNWLDYLVVDGKIRSIVDRTDDHAVDRRSMSDPTTADK